MFSKSYFFCIGHYVKGKWKYQNQNRKKENFKMRYVYLDLYKVGYRISNITTKKN